MILTNLTDRWEDDRRRISVDVVREQADGPPRTLWFEADGPPRTLWFEADGDTAAMLHPNADGFAVACLPLAVWYGEKRLRVEAELCERLRTGLDFVARVFAGWYPRVSVPVLEATGGFHPTSLPPEPRVASLLSGGVDGLTCLRVNRRDFPLGHPESICACIPVFGTNGFDVGDDGPVPERLDAFAALLGRLGELAEAESFDLLPIRTNVRHLAPGYECWRKVGFGAAHAAVGQLFQGRYTKVLLASDGDGPDPGPGAVHPIFNHHFSTDAVRVQGEQDEMFRPEKVALLADWEWGRRLMQPCHYVRIPEGGKINCGRCEKCVRTMLGLIGLGRLADVSAFAENDLTAGRVLRIPVHSRRKAMLLLQTIPALKRVGRRDLVRAVRARVALWRLVRR